MDTVAPQVGPGTPHAQQVRMHRRDTHARRSGCAPGRTRQSGTTYDVEKKKAEPARGRPRPAAVRTKCNGPA